VVGITRQHVHHLLNVTRLPEPIQEDIRVGDLKHGRAILSLHSHPQQSSTEIPSGGSLISQSGMSRNRGDIGGGLRGLTCRHPVG
jgi:hypothetical protein